MPLSRDRLARPVDISTLIPNAARRVSLIVDEPGLHRGLGAPVDNEAGSSETVRAGRGQGLNIGRANRRSWITGSGLRSWYPRTPLQDITTVTRAIERRRARNSDEDEGIDSNEGTSDQNHNVKKINDENAPPNAHLENRNTTANRAWSIVASIVREKCDASMTPEKKLLGSIEKVREVLLKDERRMQNTPSAKKAERDKKVKILMSMR